MSGFETPRPSYRSIVAMIKKINAAPNDLEVSGTATRAGLRIRLSATASDSANASNKVIVIRGSESAKNAIISMTTSVEETVDGGQQFKPTESEHDTPVVEYTVTSGSLRDSEDPELDLSAQ